MTLTSMPLYCPRSSSSMALMNLSMYSSVAFLFMLGAFLLLVYSYCPDT